MSSRWRTNILEQFANLWFKILYKKNWHFSEYSQWWYMVHHFTDKLPGVLEEFTAGDYAFSPMEKMRLPKDTLILWAYWDRLIVHLIHKIIKPTFKHILSPRCAQKGPNQIKAITHELTAALKKKGFKYFIRGDIKGYYASIDRAILLAMLADVFDDPVLLEYLDAIVNNAIDDGG